MIRRLLSPAQNNPGYVSNVYREQLTQGAFRSGARFRARVGQSAYLLGLRRERPRFWTNRESVKY